MGCDIHALIEVRKPWWEPTDKSPDPGESWVCAGDPEIGRDYEMFSVLAGVRNYLGIRPIQYGRGLPKGWPGLSEAASALLDGGDDDLHSHGYVTLAEMKAFDLGQEVDDDSLILSRDASGAVTMTCAGTTGTHLGPVGRRRVFELWGRERWDALIARLEALRYKGRDDSVRLVFAFDN